MIKTDSQNWNCSLCDYKTKYQSSLVYHIEAKHLEPSGVQCPYCPNKCPNRQALKMHISRKHK